MPTTNTTLELSKGDAAPTSTLQAALVTLASLADELPEMPDLNGMLVSVGLEKDPAVAISVFLLVFILALGACRAVCRLLRCPAAANRRRGLHRAVSTTDGAEDSDDSDAAPQPQRRRKRRPGQKQRAKVVTRNDRGMEADEEGLGSFRRNTARRSQAPASPLRMLLQTPFCRTQPAACNRSQRRRKSRKQRIARQGQRQWTARQGRQWTARPSQIAR